MRTWAPLLRHLRQRSRLQLVATALIVLLEVLGIATICLGHSDLGRSFVGLGVVLMMLLQFWLQSTAKQNSET